MISVYLFVEIFIFITSTSAADILIRKKNQFFIRIIFVPLQNSIRTESPLLHKISPLPIIGK
jgi:hypothetical protein